MRILITGANGQLGHELQRVLAAEQVTPADAPDFDLLKSDVGDYVHAARPEVVIHAAAYTNVEGAEQEQERAMAVNADGTELMARAAAKAGARLLYLSTDYVFDGEKRTPYVETDAPNPINVYGRSKLEGERRALAHCPGALVIRTSWLYGLQGKNFVKTIMKLALEQSELRVVTDQRGCPTFAGDLAVAIKRVLGTDLRGIVHATGAGDCTWYEFACAIVSHMGIPAKVHPITTAESQRPVQRPLYSVLASHVLARAGVTLPHWKDALTRFMKQVQAEVEAKHMRTFSPSTLT